MENPWHNIKTNDYDAHMSHPNVRQTQLLSRIFNEQFELIPANIRPAARVGILGITNGNGLEHVISCNIGHVVGIDINQDFLDECAKRFPNLKERLTLCRIDLMTEITDAVKVLSECDLIIANLLIKHIHLNNFMRIINRLPKHGQIISCVIQVNPDGLILSASGAEHVFTSVSEHEEVENETSIDAAMKESGYSLFNRKVYDLPNGKLFIRMDYTK